MASINILSDSSKKCFSLPCYIIIVTYIAQAHMGEYLYNMGKD